MGWLWILVAEARDSLILLTTLCPTFLILRIIKRQEWLEMPASIPPPPPVTTNTLPIAVTGAAPSSPGKIGSASGTGTGPGREVLSSPGRVGGVNVGAGVGGGRLREVRERIRRELGD